MSERNARTINNGKKCVARGAAQVMGAKRPMKRIVLIGAALCALAVPGLAKKKPAKPKAPAVKVGSEDEARSLLEELQKPGADAKALTARLRPTHEDYLAVFEGDSAAKAEGGYTPAWDKGDLVITLKPDQSDLKLFHATSDELKAGGAAAQKFPGGYKQIAPMLKKGLVFYSFKFVRPGEELGLAYDGLVSVNGHWTIFPKPWRYVH